MNNLTSYGFRYSCEGRNYSFVIEASSEKEALARSRAMAASEFVCALVRQDEVCQMGEEAATPAVVDGGGQSGTGAQPGRSASQP